MPVNHAFAIFNSIRSITAKVRTYLKFTVFSHKKLTTSKDKNEEEQAKPQGFIKKNAKRTLAFFFSYTVGLVFTAAAGAAMLFSPFGIVFGAVMCSITLAGAATTLIRKTQRFRTLERCKEQHEKLTSILELSQNNQKKLLLQNDKVKNAVESISNTLNDKLKKDVITSLESQTGKKEKSKFRNAVSKFSAKMRYLNGTSMTSSIALALPSIISGNPLAIVLFALGFSSSGYMTYDKEKNFRKSKNELLKSINTKNHELATTLGLTEEQVSKMTTEELSIIHKHTLAEKHALLEINKYALKNPEATQEDIKTQYQQLYDTALKDLPNDKKPPSFLQDMAKILAHGINTEKEGKLFSPKVNEQKHNKKTDKLPPIEKMQTRQRSASMHEHRSVGPHTKSEIKREQKHNKKIQHTEANKSSMIEKVEHRQRAHSFAIPDHKIVGEHTKLEVQHEHDSSKKEIHTH